MAMTDDLGRPVDWTPAREPARAGMTGPTVRLEPIDPARHAVSLFAVSHGPDADPELWDYLPYGPFADEAQMTAWIATCAASPDPLWFAVIDRSTGRALGMVSFMRMVPVHGVIEIGHIWFGAGLQRTSQATEAIYVLGRTAFDELGYRRLEWKCNALNARSRRAAERLGFTYEGIFRQHLVVKGRNRDTAWFSMLDGEWPVAKAAFERWLDPENFDAAGRQRQSLADLRAGIRGA